MDKHTKRAYLEKVESLSEFSTILTSDTDIKQILEEEEIHIKEEITNIEQETFMNDEDTGYLGQYVNFLSENNHVDNENDPTSESDFPSLDFFMDELEKHNLNYSKDFVGQCLKALDIRFKDDHQVCNEVYLANVPVLPKHLKQINQHFYFKNNKTPTTTAATTPSSATQATIEETITEIGIYYGCINVIPTFEDIFEKVQNLHEDITGEILKDWLNKLKVNFKINGQENNSLNNKTRRSLRCKNKPTIPTLDYFYTSLKQFGVHCSTNALKNWLDVLNVKYKLTDFKKQAGNSNVHEELTSKTITSILNIEKNFYRSSNKKLTQISSYRVKQILEAQKQNKLQGNNKKQNKKRQQENDSASNKIKRPRIETVDLTNVDNEKINNTKIIKKHPTFDDLYSKFRKAVCCKFLFKSWLDLLNINYTPGYNIEKCKKPKSLPPATVIKTLIKIDQNYSQPKTTSSLLLKLLEDIDEHFKKKDETPTLQFIDDYVLSLKHFNSNTWYSISKLEKWLNALNIKFLNEELQEEEIPNFFVYKKPLPTLDYFYEKIYGAKEKCCKSKLKEWLEFLTIKFDLTSRVPKNEDCQGCLSSSIINTLVNADRDFYEHQKLALILTRYLKIVENEFKNRNDVPTLNDYCEGINTSNFFKTCTKAYTKPQIKWLLNKLKCEVKIAKDKEDKKIPNLDYFYEKLLSLNGGDVCSKETLAYWLKLSNIKFEEHNIPIDDLHKKPIPSDFVNNLFKLFNFAKTYNLECIIEQLKIEFVSKSTPISLTDIQKRMIASGIKLTVVPNLRKWLDLIGFEYKERSVDTIPNVQQTLNVDTSIKNPEEPTKPDGNKSSAPDEVMKRLTDTEYTFFKSKTVPTLDDFQKNLEIMYGNKYAKDQTAMWLKNANIKFKRTCSCCL